MIIRSKQQGAAARRDDRKLRNVCVCIFVLFFAQRVVSVYVHVCVWVYINIDVLVLCCLVSVFFKYFFGQDRK